MKYRGYSCDLNENPIWIFLGYIIFCPYTYYVANSSHKVIDFIFLIGADIIYSIIIYGENQRKTKQAYYIMNLCKSDNIDYRHTISQYERQLMWIRNVLEKEDDNKSIRIADARYIASNKDFNANNLSGKYGIIEFEDEEYPGD